MKREPGFYWVKLKGASEWMIAEYVQVSYTTRGSKPWYEWYVSGREEEFREHDFEAIHETRLISPKEQQRQHLIDLMKTDEENGMYD